MPYHVLIISSPYLAQYVDDMFKKYFKNTAYRIVEYHAFSELQGIYLANESWADAILTTGIVVQTVLERAIPDLSKPILSLGTDNESFYRVPLSLLIEHRSLDPERIVFDVFLNFTPIPTVVDLLDYKSLDYSFPSFQQWLATASLEELCAIEDKTFLSLQQLWENHEIDLVICRYSNLVPRLKELGIPCVFAAATDEYFRTTVQHLLAQIKIQKMSAHAPAVILFTPLDTPEHTWSEHQEISLQKVLLDYAQNNDLDFMIQKKNSQILILTEKAVISYVTHNFTSSQFSNYLDTHLDFSVNVAFGIGNTIEIALENARMAYEASGISKDSFLIDEDQQLIGPLSDSLSSFYTSMNASQVQELANRCGLSTLTIQRLNRLMLLTDRRDLTSVELAESFHITMRGANRILQKLEACGLAEASFKKSAHMRGRPTKIYQIDWNR